MAHTPGIGPAIGSSWGSREALVPGADRSLATAVARWVFETGPAPLTLGREVSALARVTDGWTGEVTVAVGDSTFTVRPPVRGSTVSVLDAIVRAGSRRGGSWSWSVDLVGVVTITSTVPFELILDGTTRTRLGLTGTYAGQFSCAGASAAYELIIPSLGLALSGAEGMARGGGVSQATIGTAGAVGLGIIEESGTVRCFGTYDELVGIEESLEGEAWDVGLGGDYGGRVWVRGLARLARGINPARCVLEAGVVAVSQ